MKLDKIIIFIGKAAIFMYMAFILVPLAIIYSLAIMCWVFLKWIWDISIIKQKMIKNILAIIGSWHIIKYIYYKILEKTNGQYCQ